MRAVQITRFGGPEVLDIVDIPEPEAGDGQKLYEVSTAGVNYADTHQALFREVALRRAVTGKVLTIGQCRVGR
jgi:NADPH:quinone reductase-like Zn-dependent oxidoreductase